MRISDWSSDVCSSDLGEAHGDLLFGPVNVLDRLRRDQDAAARQPASGVDDEVAHLPGAVVEEQVMDVAEAAVLGGDVRSEERRVGQGGVSTCRSGWWPSH